MINFQPISNVLGALLTCLGVLMLLLGLGFWNWDPNAIVYFGESALLCILVGLALYFTRFSRNMHIKKREGYLLVTLSWLFITVFGALPYSFSGVVDNVPDMLFESASGFTTTGASIFNDIEALPLGILFWRSLTQWIGGMGIIVLTVAILPLLGIGGVQLFAAEAPGPKSDKIHPRIKETAKRLWLIYVAFTGMLGILLYIEGMTAFDAVNHALTTMATGGFSTKNASLAFYNDKPIIQYTVTFFMLCAGINYAVLYLGLKGKFKQIMKNDEFKAYITLILILVPIVMAGILYAAPISLEEGFRRSIFQIVSMITTTGFITDDYTVYSPFITTLFFITLFFGACAGSTSGGIKIIRHLALLKTSFFEFKRLLHPRAVIKIKMDGTVVSTKIATHILVFVLIYLSIFIGGIVVVSSMGMDFISSAGAVATSLGNVGPGIGDVGPVNNFAGIPQGAKVVLSAIMILGRLELFTILIIFTPFFWRNN